MQIRHKFRSIKVINHDTYQVIYVFADNKIRLATIDYNQYIIADSSKTTMQDILKYSSIVPANLVNVETYLAINNNCLCQLF